MCMVYRDQGAELVFLSEDEMVTFSATEKRILGLPQDFNENHLPEAIALRKVIDTFPFILEVAEHDFDKTISDVIIHREFTIMQIKHESDQQIKNYIEAKKP